MWKLMQFLGFYGDDDDDYDNGDDYNAGGQPGKKPRKQKQRRGENSSSGVNNNAPGLVLFKGVPSEAMRSRLRDALRDGTILMLDLSELSDRELDEEGRPFITFMGGVAFASGGRMDNIGREQYLVSPVEGMFEEWVEGDI